MEVEEVSFHSEKGTWPAKPFSLSDLACKAIPSKEKVLFGNDKIIGVVLYNNRKSNYSLLSKIISFFTHLAIPHIPIKKNFIIYHYKLYFSFYVGGFIMCLLFILG